jgi:hypothetical protein
VFAGADAAKRDRRPAKAGHYVFVIESEEPMGTAFTGWRRDVVFLAPIVLLFAGIVASYRDYIPYWDAKGYYDCIAHAAQPPFDLNNSRCFGHTTISYLLPLVVTQYLAPWNVSAVYAVNALLGIASIVAFHGLLRLIVPQRAPIEYALVTALYAFAPLFVVHAIFLNLDYGMTAYFVLFLYFLLARRFWLAGIFAGGVVLAKETGAAVFAATIVAYAIACIASRRSSFDHAIAELRRHAPLLIAPLALAGYVIALRLTHADAGPWVASYAQVSMLHDPLTALSINPADAGIRSFLADAFVLNYQWIYTAVLLVAACAAIVRTASARSARLAADRGGLFLSLLLLALFYVATRYRDYNNARYVLVLSPVIVALFYRALLSVTANANARRLILGVTVAVVFVSNFRTLDFVSRSVFGTFSVGSHALLDMPSIIGGPKMDAVVYNLEALQFDYLLRDLMRDVRPPPQTVFFMGDTTYNFPPNVDAQSYSLTVDPARALPLSILSLDGDVQRDSLRKHLTGAGDRFFYMAFANADNHQLRLLFTEYPLVERKRYVRNGYACDLYTFRFTSEGRPRG